MNNKAHLRTKDFDSNGDIIPMSLKEEKGDTISRKALQKTFKADLGFSSATAYLQKLKSLEKTDIVKLALSNIDNAPAVEAYTKDDMTSEYLKGYNACKDMNERPQGEWIDDCGQDGWFCSECGFFVPWYYDYYEKDIDFIRDYKVWRICPHCKAEMITYTGKDRDMKDGAE